LGPEESPAAGTLAATPPRQTPPDFSVVSVSHGELKKKSQKKGLTLEQLHVVDVSGLFPGEAQPWAVFRRATHHRGVVRYAFWLPAARVRAVCGVAVANTSSWVMAGLRPGGFGESFLSENVREADAVQRAEQLADVPRDLTPGAREDLYVSLPAVVFLLQRRSNGLSKLFAKTFPRETLGDRLLMEYLRSWLDARTAGAPGLRGVETVSEENVATPAGSPRSVGEGDNRAPAMPTVYRPIGRVPVTTLRTVVRGFTAAPTAPPSFRPLGTTTPLQTPPLTELTSQVVALVPPPIAIQDAVRRVLLPDFGTAAAGGALAGPSSAAGAAVGEPSRAPRLDEPGAVAHGGNPVAAAVAEARAESQRICMDPYTDMPKVSACGAFTVMEISVVCWSVAEMRERLERNGHAVWKEQGKKTGGEYVVAFGAVGKDRDTLKCFDRLVTVRLSVVPSRIATAAVVAARDPQMQFVLRGPQIVLPHLRSVLSLPLAIDLPAELDCIYTRNEIAKRPQLFSSRLRQLDKKQSMFGWQAFSGPCIRLRLSFLNSLLQKEAIECSKCRRAVLCKTFAVTQSTNKFKGEVLQGTCATCGVVTLMDTEMNTESLLQRRASVAAALVSGDSFAVPRTFLKLTGLPSTLARFGRSRENVCVRIHDEVLALGQEEMRMQMEFARNSYTVACAREALKSGREEDEVAACAAFLLEQCRLAAQERHGTCFRSLYEEAGKKFASLYQIGADGLLRFRDGADLSELKAHVFGGARMAVAVPPHEAEDIVAGLHLKPVSAAGDGQWSRQPRKKVGKAPHCIVSILNLRTGSVLLSLVLSKEKLLEAAKANRPFVYEFCGVTFETSYRDNECAGLEIALQILVRFVGAGAIRGFVYDCLTARDNLMEKYLPGVPGFNDSWHVMNQCRAAMDKVEESKGQSSLHGLKATFEPFLLEVMKDTTTSVADKVAKVRGWTFPGPPREMREEERTALQKLLDSVCTLVERVKPGFATSLVEAFNSTYSRNWEKGQAYCFKSFEVRMVLALLRWNRVPNWPKRLWDAAMPSLIK
jgi:hypothetical protein